MGRCTWQVMQFNNLAVAVAGDTNVFAFDVGDWASSTLYYTWDFGDGDVSDRSTNSTPTHVYTNCDPYVVGVTVDDGVVSTNASFTVAVACQLTIGKLQGTLSFAKTNADKCTVKGSISLPQDYIFAGKLVVLDVGGVTMSFTLDAKNSLVVRKPRSSLSELYGARSALAFIKLRQLKAGGNRFLL